MERVGIAERPVGRLLFFGVLADLFLTQLCIRQILYDKFAVPAVDIAPELFRGYFAVESAARKFFPRALLLVGIVKERTVEVKNHTSHHVPPAALCYGKNASNSDRTKAAAVASPSPLQVYYTLRCS